MLTIIMSHKINTINEVKSLKNILLWNCNNIENKIEEYIYKINRKEVFIINYYNPPNKDINRKVFEYIEENFQNYIICGDFNAKHNDFGCEMNKKNGTMLNEFISTTSAVILNKKDEFTFFRNNCKEILDLFICSSNLYSFIKECGVDYDSELQSDHIPIKLSLRKI
jgi:exonuclease III